MLCFFGEQGGFQKLRAGSPGEVDQGPDVHAILLFHPYPHPPSDENKISGVKVKMCK